ncbi:hypothetical protein WN943_006979 [Citrus x changshan-huyou]
MSFNTIADAVSTCHLVSAIQFSMSRSGFGAMLSAVYGFKIKSCVFDGIDSIVEDWIVDQMQTIPAGKHLMDLVAVDWFKDTKRMDHVPGSTHYSMVLYFVTRQLVMGSLLQRFVDGDDEFRNSRLMLTSVLLLLLMEFWAL